MKRLWRLLRSRKLAIASIAAFAVYAAVATVITDGDYGAPYASPVFLIIAALVALTTAACAWERTRAAVVVASFKSASPGVLARVRNKPSFVVSTRAGDAAARAESALRALGMRTVRGDLSVSGRTGLAGAFGSPVFHWALALLIVVVAFGQLTRYEGMMGVVAGSSQLDVAESYRLLDKGAFVASMSGRTIAVSEMEDSFVANGVEQGVTPYVEIRSPDGIEVLAEGYAYANHPVRYGSMLVHRIDFGLAAVLEVRVGGAAPLTHEVLLDYKEDRTTVVPAAVDAISADGQRAARLLIEPAAGSTPEAPTVRIVAFTGDGSTGGVPEVDALVTPGEEITVADGMVFRVVRLTKYARLSVVNDWSVYVIYALFLVAMLGLMLAVFSPLRAVHVVLAEQDGERGLYVAVRHSRGDPHFAGRVERALRKSFETEEMS